MVPPLNLPNQKSERLKTCPQCDTGYPDSHTTCPTHGVLLNEIRDLKPGMVIHQSYRIIRKLGQGGMGAVYLAQHMLMNEPQALKFLSSELSQDEAFTARFLREVRTLRQIRHKNVVDAGNLEPAEDGTLFFSMEFVDGPNLRGVLNNATGPFPVAQALSITRGIAEGLGAAHAKGMVHRDIKPENILMARDGDAWLPKIADFGIVATKESSTAYTRTGGTLLTMAYAAPEQWRGTAAAELDGRTDLYALGGLLYEMLTGRTPFHAENYEGWADQHRNVAPQPPSTLRPDLANWQGLDALVLRLLAKDCNDRPKDVIEVIGLIDAQRYVSPRVSKETVKRDTVQDSGTEPIVGADRSVLLNRIRKETSPYSVNEFVGRKAKRTPHRRLWLGLFALPLLLVALIIGIYFFGSEGLKQYVFRNLPVTLPLQYAKEQRAIALYNQKRYSEASPLLDQACFGGSGEACKDLGNLYNDGNGVVQDYHRAVELFSKSCDIGYAIGCNNLGNTYSNGRGVKLDYSRAVTLYSKSCNMGEARGCFNLGNMYYLGKGVAKDVSRVATLFAEACDGGFAIGCRSLGALYLGSVGLAKDDNRAVTFFSKACDGGDADGCSALGSMYGQGAGVIEDQSHAAALYKKGCDADSAMGCTALGLLYSAGVGVQQDSEKARRLVTKACSMGDQWGCNKLKQLR
jgi:serine/threonine protein kinase/TPR repeat protein